MAEETLERRVQRLEQNMVVLKRQRVISDQRHRGLEERVDTVFSWPWKRLWWAIRGFRWYTVGRWYGQR